MLTTLEPGHEYDLSREDDVGDLEFKWLREFGPTWKVRAAFGVSSCHTLCIALAITKLPRILQHDAVMTADPKVRSRSLLYYEGALELTA